MIKTIQTLDNKPIISKAFFGKSNCLKLVFNKKKECYFQFGQEKAGEWEWKNVKFSDIELGVIIQVLEGRKEKASFFHSFGDKKTQIWLQRVDNSVIIKIKEVSKALNEGEQEVLGILLKRIILQKNTEW